MLPSKLKKLIRLPEVLIGIHNETSFSKFTTKKNYRASIIWDKNQEDEEGKFLNILLQCVATSRLDNAKAIHAKQLKNPSGTFSLYLHNHLLNAYVKCGDTANGLKLFDEMTERNVVF